MKEAGLDIESLEKHFLVSDEKYLQVNEGKAAVTTEQENLKRRERRDSDSSKPQGLITLAEDRSVGTISTKLYWRYFRSGLPAVLLILLSLLFFFSQGKLDNALLTSYHIFMCSTNFKGSQSPGDSHT